jgi:uncharacterized protein YbaP (TraB family)
MRRRPAQFILCASLLALVQILPNASSCAYAQAVTPEFDKGLLWRLEKPGVAPSYLFGTMHIADKRITNLPDVVRRQFDAARTFTMEISPDPSNIAQLAARMVYMDGRDLPGVVGADLFKKIVPLIADLGLPAEMARLFKPWAMVLILEMPQQQTADVLDFMLQSMASQQGKALNYLESIDEQVAVFESMSEAEQIALLEQAVATYPELKTQTEKLVQAYLQRDLRLMWQISEAEMEQRPELKALKQVVDQRLLYDRNARMVERMQLQLKTGAAFVAVGALHLYGEKGLLSLLARDGYRVSRVY